MRPRSPASRAGGGVRSLDDAQLRIGDFDNDDIKKTFCHEIGHSVGLMHGHISGYVSCMMSGPVPDTSSHWKHYSTHHKGHINAQY